jgi:hypothetical protein
MTCYEKWNLFIQGGVVVGALLLAFIAIFGDYIRLQYLGPKLKFLF